MDAIAAGDTKPWDRVLDPRAIITTEEGEVIPRAEFLKNLCPLPPGLAGGIVVRFSICGSSRRSSGHVCQSPRQRARHGRHRAARPQ